MKNILSVGAAVILSASTLSAAEIILCGDSIMADYRKRDPRPCYGWGEFLGEYCPPGTVVKDFAVPGSGTKSWREKGFWRNALAETGKGDLVLLGFGFNDGAEENPAVFVDEKDFGKNLLEMVEDVRRLGARPVLLTSTEIFRAPEKTLAKHRSYNEVVRRAAQKADCPLIDLYPVFSAQLAAVPDPGVYFVCKREVPVPNWLDFDNVHLNREGAQLAARIVGEELVRQKLLSVPATSGK